MESILRGLVAAIFQLICELVFWSTARIALRVLTFGRWRVEALNTAQNQLPWYGVKRQPNGTLLFSYMPGVFLGMGIWLVAGILLLTMN